MFLPPFLENAVFGVEFRVHTGVSLLNDVVVPVELCLDPHGFTPPRKVGGISRPPFPVLHCLLAWIAVGGPRSSLRVFNLFHLILEDLVGVMLTTTLLPARLPARLLLEPLGVLL